MGRSRVDSATVWTAVARSGIGRPAAHSREEITIAAVAIADAAGLAAASMRRVATAIGAGAMSLYSYVPDKDTLVELMIDHVIGDMDLAEPTGDPLADLRGYARSQRTTMRRHPWLPASLAGRQTVGPHALAGMDHLLAILAGTHLDTTAKMELLALLTGFVANYVTHEVAQVEVARRTGRSVAESAAAEVAYLTAAARSGRYPHLAQALAPPPPPVRPAQAAQSLRPVQPVPSLAPTGGAPRDTDPGDAFDRLVDRIIGGLLA